METHCWARGRYSIHKYIKVNTILQIEASRKDALLYPGKADEETLRKMPPTIIWEAEFDIYITEAQRNAES